MLLNTLIVSANGTFCSHIYKENKMELWKSNTCRGIDIFGHRVCTSCICRKIGDIDDIIFNTLGFLIGYILENLLQKILLKKQLGFGTEALVLVMINGFLSIPFYEKTVSIGDMILDSLNLNSWSGNSGYILSYNGIHYTMIPCIILAVISWAIAHRHPKDYGAKTAKIISIFMIVCFIGNFIQILSQDSIIPMLLHPLCVR